jgi:hypothetical protein
LARTENIIQQGPLWDVMAFITDRENLLAGMVNITRRDNLLAGMVNTIQKDSSWGVMANTMKPVHF